MKDHSIRWFALCLAVGYGLAGCKSRNAPEGSVTVTSSENGSVRVEGDKGSGDKESVTVGDDKE